MTAASRTVTLDVPVIYDFLGTNRRQRHHRSRHAIDHVLVALPTVDHLPQPFYAAYHEDQPDVPFLSWHLVGDKLLRPVMAEGRPATFREIERATALVSPPWWDEEWFDDHPSSIYRLPRRQPHYSHFEPLMDLDGYAIVGSNLDQRLTSTCQAWSDCVEHGGMVLAPARPPTWCVRVGPHFAYLAISASRMPSLVMPEFHFGIRQAQAARDFADRVTDGGEVIMQPLICTYPSEDSGQVSGALETTRAFAFCLCKRLAGRNLYSLSRDQIAALTGLRNMFENFGTDVTADHLLEMVEGLEWPGLRAELRAWHAMLAIRREVLGPDGYLMDFDFDGVDFG